MTTRDLVNREVRARMICLLLSPLGFILALFLGAFLAERAIPEWLAFGLCLTAGSALCLASIYRTFTKWRCPACREPLLKYGQKAGLLDDILKMPAAFRYCPYCGQSFDEQIQSQRE
jgi:hypothetical protein